MSFKRNGRRNRTMKQQRFSDKEKQILADEVMDHAEELFSKNAVKLLGKNISVKRHGIWIRVAKKVSKADNTRRMPEDCQKAWHNYKRQIARTIDEIKKNYFDTGNLEALNNILDKRQMDVVRYFRMDSDLEMKSQQLSDHSSLQEDCNQNKSVEHQLSQPPPPAAGPSVQIHPPLPPVAAVLTKLPRQPMTVAASSPSAMTSFVGARRLPSMTSTSLSRYNILSFRGSNKGKKTPLAQRTVTSHRFIPPEGGPSVQIPPPKPPLQPVPLPATPLMPVTVASSVASPVLPPISSQHQTGTAIALPHSRFSGQTSQLVQKKMNSLSTSITLSRFNKKIEKLQKELDDMKEELKKAHFNFDLPK